MRDKTVEKLVIGFHELCKETDKYKKDNTIWPSPLEREWSKLKKVVDNLKKATNIYSLEQRFPQIYEEYCFACNILYPRNSNANPWL